MPAPKRAPARKLWPVWLALVSLLVLAAGVFMRRCEQRQVVQLAPERAEPEKVAAPKPVVIPKRRPVRAPVRAPSPGCVDRNELRCDHGDAWAVDSCGNLLSKQEECEQRACKDGACEPEPEEPCLEPENGRCVGNTVRLCYAGRPREINCAAKNLLCVYREEGAECAEPIPPELACSGPPVCDGEVLVHCVKGRAVRSDCTSLGALCRMPSGAPYPACMRLLPSLPGQSCGPCGCPAKGEEDTCDGQDDDGDGLVDEGLDCGEVPVIAFIVTDARGQSSYAPEDIDEELVRVNQLFTSSGVENAPVFVLEELNELPDPSLLNLDSKGFGQLLSDPRVHPARPSFYVPMVFTESVHAGGETPKFGISTLPNSTCGGLQDGRGPDVGVIAVAKARAPTTAAHELGHFLGLCHTHDQQQGTPLLAAAGDTPQECASACRFEGDGVCDTPFDPGAPRCAIDQSCHVFCGGDAEPDGANLMSYYTPCRMHFTPEQMALVQHSLALRRAWHKCLGHQCTCSTGGSDCPVGMSCRTFVTDSGQRNSCELDGPRGPGADCKGPLDCGRNSTCLEEQNSNVKRCVRACLTDAPGCSCTKVADDLRICSEDLRLAR